MLTDYAVDELEAPTGKSQSDNMIESITIKNFKCFKELSLSGLGSVNVVVGDNAAGKTALLEAIYLSQFTTHQLVEKIRKWRGIPSTEVKFNREGYESTWRDLFFEPSGFLVGGLNSGFPWNHRKHLHFQAKNGTQSRGKGVGVWGRDLGPLVPPPASRCAGFLRVGSDRP